MNQILPLSQWLSPERNDETIIAWQGERIWTLSQLRYDVTALLATLKEQEGERWALCVENSYLFIVTLLAVLHAGKIPVILGHSRPLLLDEQRSLFDGVLSDKALTLQSPSMLVCSKKCEQTTRCQLPPIAAEAFVEIFTSGSTGHPKRVIKNITALDLEAALLGVNFAKRLADCRTIASVVPYHLYGLTFSIFLPMSCGLPLHAAMIFYPEELAALNPQHRYLFISSPAFLKRLDHHLSPPPVAMLFSAGGVLPQHDAANSHAWLGIWPDEIYGSTETGILAWRHRQFDDIPWRLFSGVKIVQEGDAFRAWSTLIADADGVLLDDMLHFNNDDSFHLSGRRGRIVKIEEKRISLNEIEKRLTDLDGILEAAAIPITRGNRQAIGVLLVLDDKLRSCWQGTDKKRLEQSWRQALRQWLEPVAIPRYWQILDEIPVNSMSKRVYTQLQELFNETF
ncbi:MAG: AMP-binding protein [Enterovibrio sp.]